jgi:type I restriction enzyme S subunit
VKAGYKQTEVGVIPEDWLAKPLGDVLTLQRGFDLPSRLRREGTVPIVSSSGTSGTHCEARVSAPGIVTGRYGTIGQVFFIEQDFWPLNTTLYVRAFKGNDPRYLSYLLRTVDFESHSGKSGVPGVNRNDIHELLVPLPPLPEQTAIAKALSDVDTLLGALDRLIAKKRDLNQAAMQQLLTGQTRLPSFHGDREVKRLGDVATIKDGTHQTPKYVDSGIPFYSVEHVTSGDFKNTKYISVAEHRLLTRISKIEKGDILMTRIGSIGDCKLVDWDVDASFYVSLALLKINPGFSAAYITHYSKSTAFKKEVELHSLQSAIPKKINLGPISEVKIEFPSLAEQVAIAEVLSEMEAEIAGLEQQRQKTRAIKLGMMQELLTGRTRLFSSKGSDA